MGRPYPETPQGGSHEWPVWALGHRVADHDILPAVWVLGPGSELVPHPSPGNGVVRVDPGPELGGG